MATIMRVTSEWSGFSGAPGYTVLHFRDFGTGGTGGTDPDPAQAQSAVDRVAAFWTAINVLLPNDVTITVNGEVEFVEDSTGDLLSIQPVTQPAASIGTAAGSYSPATGMVVNWRTDLVRNGRRIRGRSFIVPISSASYTVDGALAPADREFLQQAAQDLADPTLTPDLGVYARPTTSLASDGQWAVVSSAQVPPLVAVLRSRRD